MKVTVTAGQITRVVDGETVYVDNGDTVDVGDTEAVLLLELGVAVDADVPDAAAVPAPGNAPVTETTPGKASPQP